MPLVTDKVCFIHIPKTGGIWVRNMMKHLGLNPIDVGDQHDYFPAVLRLESREFFEKRFVFTIVRHPITWYQSRWAFRVKSGWQSRHPLDWWCASNDFHVFVDNVLKWAPNGWCSWLYNSYANPPREKGEPSLVDYVGRFENLEDDFIYAMRQAGHDIDEEKVRNFKAVNSSTMGGFSSNQLARYTPELYNRVIAVENEAIQKYYYNYDINPSNHCGDLLY